jgi:hypothetical protein
MVTTVTTWALVLVFAPQDVHAKEMFITPWRGGFSSRTADARPG